MVAIARLALGYPEDAGLVVYRTREDTSQDYHIEGLPFGTRGGMLVPHVFPSDGEYMVMVTSIFGDNMWPTGFGSVPWRFLLNGELLGQLDWQDGGRKLRRELHGSRPGCRAEQTGTPDVGRGHSGARGARHGGWRWLRPRRPPDARPTRRRSTWRDTRAGDPNGFAYHAVDASLMTDEDASRVQGVDETVDLLARARTGDDDALDRLFERHIPLLRRWASGRLPRWARQIADTSDLVQETVIATMRNLDSFEPRGEGALQAYLRHALINRVRNEMRRALLRPAATEIDSQLPHDGASPLETAIGSQTLERYEAALARLTAEEREAVVTRVEFGLSYAEVAEALGKRSADAARMAVVRALVKLAREMDLPD